jgi:peptide subunit release factor 1 (eRF1)
VREEAETRHIDQLIEQIQEYAGAGGRGSIGLKDTLQALNEQKVHIILVQEGYSEPGAECPSCGLLMGSQKETCSACGTETQTVENVVDAAIQRAMELGSIVEVATEIDKLQPIQCIGSIMYY